MRRVRIPEFPLSDYADPRIVATGVYVDRFERSLASRPSRTGIHRHGHFELFRLRGAGVHFNDFTEHPLAQDSLVVIRPGQVHGWPDADRLRGTMIGFTQEFFDGGRLPPSALFRYGFFRDRGPVIPVEPAAARALDATFAAISTEFAQRDAEWAEIVRNHLHIVVAQIARLEQRRQNRPAIGRAPELARRFQLLLEEQFRTMRSVAAYARKLGVTPGHLSDSLRDDLGRSAGELIHERILLEARRCLVHSERSVSEIGYGLGYDDPSYFVRFFRQSTGVTPATFRAVHREKCQRFRD